MANTSLANMTAAATLDGTELYYGLQGGADRKVTGLQIVTLVTGGGNLSITIGKTLTVSNSLTLVGTDGTTMTFPGTTGTVVTLAATQTLTNKTLTSTTDVLGGVTMTLGSDATGDIYYRNSSGVLTRLAIGTGSQVIGVSGGIPAWVAQSGGSGLTVGTTTITSGSTTNILYNNGGVLGEYTISGTGTVIPTTASPAFTGTLSAAAITGSGIVKTSSAGSASAPSLVVGNATTGLYSVSTTGLGLSVNGTSVFDYGISNASKLTLPSIVTNGNSSITASLAATLTVGTANSTASNTASTFTILGGSNASASATGGGAAVNIAAGSASGTTSTGNGGTLTLSAGTTVGGTAGSIILKTGTISSTTAITVLPSTQVTFANLLNLPPLTVSTLPASPINGSVALVTDATSNVLIGAGGGSAYALVAYNGSAWVAV